MGRKKEETHDFVSGNEQIKLFNLIGQSSNGIVFQAYNIVSGFTS